MTFILGVGHHITVSCHHSIVWKGVGDKKSLGAVYTKLEWVPSSAGRVHLLHVWIIWGEFLEVAVLLRKLIIRHVFIIQVRYHYHSLL